MNRKITQQGLINLGTVSQLRRVIALLNNALNQATVLERNNVNQKALKETVQDIVKARTCMENELNKFGATETKDDYE